MMNKLPNIEYNGWTNYETWRINLELFDGTDEYYIEDVKYWLKERDDYNYGDVLPVKVYEFLCHFVGVNLRHEFEAHIEEYCLDDTLQGLLKAYASDVNWYEIATHLVDKMLDDLKIAYVAD